MESSQPPNDLSRQLTQLCTARAVGGRRLDTALLLWFLEQVERLDSVEAEDAVIDRQEEPEVDGLWVDDLSEQVTLLQAVWTQDGREISPGRLEATRAVIERINTPAGLGRFSARQLQPELQGLLDRQNLAQFLNAGYEVRFVLVTNAMLSAGARAQLSAVSTSDLSVVVWDLSDLALYIRYANRPLYIEQDTPLRFAPRGVFAVSLPGSVPVLYGALGADQIAALPGIEDRTLFAQNVRLDLGRTRVNKDLAATVADPDEHARFLTFHNGLTILCQSISQSESEPESVTIRGYSVVNGCQSALAFYQHREQLTPALLVPVRLVQVGDTARLADDITYRSNNQNAISLKDLRANDSTQVQLQAEFRHVFGASYGYQIKRGEQVHAEVVIPNDLAAQILLALYVEEPWQAHRKSALFAERYKQIFRPEMRAPQIVLGYILWEVAQELRDQIEDPLLGGYGLTVFILIYLMGRLMRETSVGAQILQEPLAYVQQYPYELRDALRLLLADIIVDLDAYVREESDAGYFDYKSRFKSQAAVRHLTEDIVRSHKKAVNRDSSAAFGLRLPSES